MTSIFGQVVIGPPGSGKTTFCHEMTKFLQQIGRKVAVVNIDPANDGMSYEPAIDISNLITLEDVMDTYHLGPNGGLMYCMEFLEKNMDWLFEQIGHLKGHYFIFDCPGQVELYTHHNSVKNIMDKLVKFGLHLCAINVVDSHYCSDPGKFISALLMSLTTMLNMGLPHVNILSKTDLTERYGKLLFHPSYYTEVLDLEYLLDALNDDPLTTKRGTKLNKAMVELIEGYSLVSFLPLCINNKEMMGRVRAAVDTANGYIFGSGEERSVDALLSSAVGANFAGDRSFGVGE
ncbi:GPN-loop GTPase 2 [Hetaerina americana]|uniref:GPN-loop GTPase 2 n=1 Tax=Hetaerina americana TaxID=62018 RepID=UPI003A7F459C